jgi:hypothetical protein
MTMPDRRLEVLTEKAVQMANRIYNDEQIRKDMEIYSTNWHHLVALGELCQKFIEEILNDPPRKLFLENMEEGPKRYVTDMLEAVRIADTLDKNEEADAKEKEKK